jgi:hypothetical protein
MSLYSDTLDKLLPLILNGIDFPFHERRVRRQLYQEIAENNHRIVVHIARCTCIAGLVQVEALRFTENLGLSFNTWNYYTGDEGRKALLYRLDNATTIVRIYEKFTNIYADALEYPHVRGKAAAAEVDDSLVEQKLDRKLYQSVSSKEAWAYMAELLDGKRESYGCYLNPLTRPIR